MQKKKTVLKSRKFWAALVAGIIVFLKTFFDLPDEVVKALVVLASVYIGGVALEDGLKGIYSDLSKDRKEK